MGGALFVFTKENDASIVHNSTMINLNMAEVCKDVGVGKIFYSSSACVYPSYNQEDPNNPMCPENSVKLLSSGDHNLNYSPDSIYGLEKLFF